MQIEGNHPHRKKLEVSQHKSWCLLCKVSLISAPSLPRTGDNCPPSSHILAYLFLSCPVKCSDGKHYNTNNLDTIVKLLQ